MSSKRIKNKRGMNITSALIAAILISVSLIILLSIMYNIKRTQRDTEWETICSNSVSVMASSVALTKAHYASELKCPTKYYEVKPRGIYYEGKLKERIPKGKMEEVLKKAVSDDLAECWSAFHKGDLELFKDDGKFCVVCSEWHFDDSIDIKANGLLDFMKTNYVPGTNTNYYEYIEDFKTKKTEALNANSQAAVNEAYFINTSKTRDYVTTFTYVKGKNNIDNLLAKTKGATPGIIMMGVGLGVAIVTGPAGWIAYTAYAVIAGGGMLAGIESYFSRAEPQWIAFVSFRGLKSNVKSNGLKDLNCEVLPVKQNINK